MRKIESLYHQFTNKMKITIISNFSDEFCSLQHGPDPESKTVYNDESVFSIFHNTKFIFLSNRKFSFIYLLFPFIFSSIIRSCLFFSLVRFFALHPQTQRCYIFAVVGSCRAQICFLNIYFPLTSIWFKIF
jgi:hypothetical protein